MWTKLLVLLCQVSGMVPPLTCSTWPVTKEKLNSAILRGRHPNKHS
jgi:hypothetical protein